MLTGEFQTNDHDQVSRKPVKIHVVIPTMGRRHHLLGVIEQLRDFAALYTEVEMKVIVSFNPRTPAEQTVFLDEVASTSLRFELSSIRPERYQINSEEHLLWLMDWYRQNATDQDAYVWALTDYDPVMPDGFKALVKFLEEYTPDMFYMNNVWGDTLGELLPSLSIRANQLIWRDSSPAFFQAIGFAHATTCIGTLFIRSGFLDQQAVESFREIFERSEVNAHAWWGFELAQRGDFYFHATPIVMNKFNAHNFDHAVTWKEATESKKQASKWPWIVGYLRHLEVYLDRGILKPSHLRASMISEAQRGILPFMDELVRQMFVQMRLSLRHASERYSADDIRIIKKVFRAVYPLRMPLIDAICIALDGGYDDPATRLLGFKQATKIRMVETEQGVFSYLFVASAYGYVIYEHRIGFLACLRKMELFRGYRDLDPYDISPFLMFAKTEEEIRDKISAALKIAKPEYLVNEFDYVAVNLREVESFSATSPQLQIYLLSLPPRLSVWLLFAIGRSRKLMRRVGRAFNR